MAKKYEATSGCTTADVPSFTFHRSVERGGDEAGDGVLDGRAESAKVCG